MNELVSMSKERFAKYCEDNSTFEESISRIINHYFLWFWCKNKRE
ncbi:hypothetical protein ABH948_005728 [Bacillus sp. RC218]